MKLLKVIELDEKGNSSEPVNYVCFHPIAIGNIMRGKLHSDITGEEYKPICCAVDYEYDSILDQLCKVLGWQGGTLSQVIDEIKRLKGGLTWIKEQLWKKQKCRQGD